MIKRTILKLIRKRNNYLLDKSYKKNSLVVKGYPNGLMFEPFSKCNYHCPLCPSGLGILKRDNYIMTFDNFKNYLKPLRFTTEYVTLWHFGEPFLNNELDKFVRYCRKYYIETQISTNGSLMKGELLERLFLAGVDRLIISLDTNDADIYPRYRVGGEFSEIIENIKAAVQLRNDLQSSTRIIVQYMIMKDNEDIESMKKHGISLGVDEVLIKTIGIGTSITDVGKGLAFLPKDKSYRRYEDNADDKLQTKLNDFSCKYIWKRMLICSDGSCIACVRDQNNEYVLGKVSKETSLKKIWNNEKYQEFRKLTLTDIGNISCCSRCPEILKYKIDPWVDKKEESNCVSFQLK